MLYSALGGAAARPSLVAPLMPLHLLPVAPPRCGFGDAAARRALEQCVAAAASGGKRGAQRPSGVGSVAEQRALEQKLASEEREAAEAAEEERWREAAEEERTYCAETTHGRTVCTS